MLTLHPRPAIIAHRGASLLAPENTMAAFELAVREAADAIELDVKLTQDQQVVVIHDQTVDRTTEGTGRVAATSLREIQKLDAGSWFDPIFKDEKIPTLEEVLETFGQQILFNIELTNYTSINDALPAQVAALVIKSSVEDRVLFSSFNPLALIQIQQLLPATPCGLLAMKGWQGALARSALGSLIPHQALHPHYSDINVALVTRAHGKGRWVHAYTVNHREEIATLVGLGVDGIITDNPSLAQQVLKDLLGRKRS